MLLSLTRLRLRDGPRDLFPCEQSLWHCAESQRWLEELERLGTEKVRQILTGPGGAPAAISVGSMKNMTKGFAQDWLAWKDQKKSKDEAALRRRQFRWQRWDIILATGGAAVTVVNWFGADNWARALHWLHNLFSG
jgi:hypothetical protein